MDPEDSIAVVPSVENGMLPAETEPTPSEPTEPVAPTVEPTEPVTPPTDPPAPTEELFELPDGRKVDAATLTKEWKENFYPEYTRKSQELAKVKTGEAPITTEPAKGNLDDWVPQSYAEIVQKAKEEMKADLIKEQEAQEQQTRAIEETVTTQLSEVKAKDPTVNENALFMHATKYGFRDLRLAHQNMKDMAGVIKTTQQETVKNVAKRNDPVSSTPGATGARPDPSQFQNARDYLRSLK
jgi:hypothetical protein